MGTCDVAEKLTEVGTKAQSVEETATEETSEVGREHKGDGGGGGNSDGGGNASTIVKIALRWGGIFDGGLSQNAKGGSDCSRGGCGGGEG